MSQKTLLIVLFWVVVGSMLIWQFNDYNQTVTQQDQATMKPEHYFFYNTNVVDDPAHQSKPHPVGADVQQTSYSVEDNAPGVGSFTCHAILKNEGTVKAVDIQIFIRPYRKSMLIDGEMINHPTIYLDDNDPRSQFGQWVSVPDLEPGHSARVDAIFTATQGIPPGKNPDPKIIFGNDKSNP